MTILPRLAAVVLAIAAAGSVAASPVDGTWRLVEQTYEKGGANLAPAGAPVYLELVSAPGGATGSIWAGNRRAAAREWPSWEAEGKALPVAVVARRATTGGGVQVVYRVRPAADDTVLEITESYEPTPDGSGLVGTLEVRFTGEGSNRGGYVLHRRFTRER